MWFRYQNFTRTLAAMGEAATWSKESVVRGHHVYKTVWMPYIGQCLRVSREENNDHDDYAISVINTSGTVVGHALRKMSRTFWYFLRHEGEIECEITGRSKRGNGLEVPCTYHCTGQKKFVKRLETLLSKHKGSNAYSCPF